MLFFNRHRSRLLTFCALVLLLLTSATAVGGVQLRPAATHGKVARAMMVVQDNEAVANAAHASSDATATDDSTGSGSQCDSDGGLDDQIVLPVLVQVMLHTLRAGVPFDTFPFLRSNPSFGLLRPPRAI